MSTTLTGYDAIFHAEATRRTLSKYADPTEAARDGLTPDQAREIAAEDPGLVYIELGELESIELYEDNGGKLWLVPLGEGIAITMPSSGDFLTDARTYRDTWTPEDFPHDLHKLEDIQGAFIDDPQTTHLATYRPRDDRLTVHLSRDRMGHAGRAYLSANEREEV